MPTVGLSEWIVILMILLLVFGASRLPKIGEGLGRSVRNLKRAMSDGAATEGRSRTADARKPASAVDDAEIVDKPRE